MSLSDAALVKDNHIAAAGGVREAVVVVSAHRETTGRDVLLKASGGLTLDNERAVAETGVHFISVGGLTHSSPILDIGLDFETLV